MPNQNSKSFTLIELLIVLAIIAILVTVLILTINPGAIFSRARDTKRINDLKNIEKIMDAIYATEYTFNELNYASSNVVYISLPDSSSTCGSWLSGLPSLPSGWSYHCSATPTNIDGTGWIPIPFSNFPILNISQLPIDPINKPPYYYSFVVGGSYKVTAKPEENYSPAIDDGGIEPLLYEVGTNKKLSTFQSGLVGYWSLDEGTGTIAYDLSGYGNDGTLNNFNFNEASGWITGKIGKALIFDGIDDYVSLSQQPFLSNGFTFSVWVKIPSPIPSGYTNIFNNNQFYIRKSNSAEGNYWDAFVKLSDNSVEPRARGIVAQVDVWTHLVVVWDKVMLKIYVNSEPKGNVARTGDLTSTTVTAQLGRGAGTNTLLHPFLGIIDEVRIYNRALSPAEIKALYESTR
jgi:prepilin-type N-terminal cleavage/methylation domain-containing protein